MTEPGSLLPPLERDFEFEVRTAARGTVVTLTGELDVASSPILEAELGRLSDAALVVVDLRGLSFIDSTGLGVLVRAHQVARAQGHRFGLVRTAQGGRGQVSRLLTLTGLDEELLIGDSVEQLLGAA